MLAVKKNDTIKPLTRFFASQILMFAKLSLKSFVYDLVETFMFPNQKPTKIYKKYNIDFVYVYHLLTDTESTSIRLVILQRKKQG